MNIIEMLNSAFEMLVPPPTADHQTQYIYQLRVTTVACAAFLGLIASWVLAAGLVPSVFGGFAKASTLDKVWKYQLDESIFTLRRQECQEPSGDLKATYTAMINRRMNLYDRVAGKPYPLPACSDL